MAQDEIKTRVTIDGDQALRILQRLSDAERQYAAGTAKMGEAADQSGRQVESRRQKLSALRQRLEDLVRAELQHEQMVQRGGNASVEASAASSRRQGQIDRLSRVLAGEDEVQRRVTAGVRAHAAAEEKASAATASRSERLDRLRGRLDQLARAEFAQVQAQQRGVRLTEQEQAASLRRQRQIDRIASALAAEEAQQRRATDAVRRAGEGYDAAGRPIGAFGREISALQSQVSLLVGGMLGTAGLVAALRLTRQEMQENAKAANDLKSAQLDLQFLNQGFNAAELAAVRQFSERTGRDQAEVATAFAELKSKTAGLTDDERLAAFRQIGETSLTTPGSLTSLVNAFAFGLSTVPDAEILQNLLRGVQREAGVSSTEQVAQLFPDILTTGRETGLNPAESGGIFAFATARVPDTARARTQARNILLRLQGDQTPEAEAILTSAGATSDVGVIEQLRRLNAAQQRGELGAKEITQLFGTENFVLGSQLISDIGDVEKTIGRIGADVSGGRDLTREAIENIFAGDEQQRLRLQAAQIEQQIKNQRAGDIGSQRVAVARQLLERELRASGASPARIAVQLAAFDAAASVGASAESALQIGFTADPRVTGGNVDIDMAARDRAFSDLGAGPDLDVSQIGASETSSEITPATSAPPASAGTVINNTTNITTQMNMNRDGTTPFTGSTGRGGRAR